MNCPRCETHPPLQAFEKKSMYFFGCHACRGVLLEKRALENIVKELQHDQKDFHEGYFGTLVAAAEFTDNRQSVTCPHCKYNMYETASRGDVKLDFCLNCQSIWFDAGELQNILHRIKHGERFNLVPLPKEQVDHASGLILHLLRDQWL